MPVLEQHLLHALAHLQHVAARVGPHRTPSGARLGLTSLQIAVLGVVFREENPSMSAVAADQLVHRPAATRLVNELVTRGLIERSEDPADRRVVRLRLTRKGRAAVDRVHAEAHALLGRVLRYMSAAEQQALLVGLEGFARAVRAVEEEGDLP